LGDLLGPLLIGVLSQAFGLTADFLVCGLFGLVAVAAITVPRRLTLLIDVPPS